MEGGGADPHSVTCLKKSAKREHWEKRKEERGGSAATENSLLRYQSSQDVTASARHGGILLEQR